MYVVVGSSSVSNENKCKCMSYCMKEDDVLRRKPQVPGKVHFMYHV